MKIKPVAQLLGLGAGALFGGPLFACLGSTCGGFVGDLLADADEGGFGFGNAASGVLGNLFAGKIQPWLDEGRRPDFNHDLRRAAARALADCLAWKKKPGPLAAALLRTSAYEGLNSARRAQLQRILQEWQKRVSTQLAAAEKDQDASRLDAILPPGGSLHFTRLSDPEAAITTHVQQSWAAFYEQTLQPVLDALPNKDTRAAFPQEDLQRHVITALETVFPAAFSQVVKSPDHRPAWIAWQKTLLSGLQRAVQDIGAQTGRLPEIEKKLSDLLAQEESTSTKLLEAFSRFEDLLAETRDNTVEIKTDLKKTHEKLDQLLQRQPLHHYFSNLRHRFSKHNALGIPAVEDTKQKQGPDDLQDLFVPPACSATRLRPEDLPAALLSETQKPLPLLSRIVARHFLMRDRPRIELKASYIKYYLK